MFRVSRTPAGVKTAAAKFVGQLNVRAYSGFFTIGKTELTVGNFDRGESGKFRNFPNRRSFGIFDEKKSGLDYFYDFEYVVDVLIIFFARFFQVFHVFPFSADVGMLELRKDGAVR